MDFFEKSLRTLELPAVLEMLSAEAVSQTAKQEALKLFPSKDFSTVKARQEETAAAKNMMVKNGSPYFSGISDVRDSVKRADIGGALNTRELLDVALLLRAAAAAISYASGERDEKTAIDYLFSALRSNKYLENKISSSIISEDEIADSASSELSDIRRHMRLAGDKVRQILNKVITSPAYSKALQEPIITVRNDRYVVPVKAEQKSALPGLVHDISSSGQTLFIEPMGVVQANNELRELLAREKKEIERILMELSADVAEHGEDIISDFQVLCELDLIFAKAKLSYRLNAAGPEIAEDGPIILRQARHPLLPAKTAVPIDLRLGGEFDTLVITGPNTGGKTVTLKTLGLLSAMTACGLHIPAADGSRMLVLDAVLADIGDEQSIEQSLSTFSSHMTNIVRILEGCREGTLLLFDELGAGTDPVEGAALAISIIEHARRRGALIAATTHYSELKTYAPTSEGVMNASCEFDVETLRPTYKLILGIPGKSNAFAISERLGIPASIIEDAKGRIGSESASFEEVLEDLENTRKLMENERMESKKLLSEAEESARKVQEHKERLEREKERSEKEARREAERILSEARRTADAVMEELSQLRKSESKGTDWQRVNEAKAGIYRRLNELEDSLLPESLGGTENPETPQRKIEAGDRVKLNATGTLADVISVSRDGVLSLQAGIMKITARENEVRLTEEEPLILKGKQKTGSASPKIAAISPELDLRGMMTDEAVPVLERYLDTASHAKLNSVTIIHGKGTGALRQAVHQSLKRESCVRSFRLGRYGEGENGVTVVELK